MTGGADKLAIIAGGGALPIVVAEGALAAGRSIHVLGIDGEVDATLERYPFTRVGIGQVGRILETLKRQGCRDIVIAGTVGRPELARLHLDLGALANLPRLAGMMLGGDNHLLSTIVRFFESKGFRVLGAHDVAPQLLAGEGVLGRERPSREAEGDIARGLEIVRALGTLDVGQAVVVSRGYVLAVEAAEGTDALLERVASLRATRFKRQKVPSGVLVKRAKPGQERRVDLPTIGPRTVALAAGAGLQGIAVHAGNVLLIEREQLLRDADAARLFVVGVRDEG